jgi:signal transduction histidine kinase
MRCAAMHEDTSWFRFIRKNPVIAYSALLIVVVTSVIFFNTYYSLKKFEESVDTLVKSRAAIVGDFAAELTQGQWGDWEVLEREINTLYEENTRKQGDIRGITLITNENEKLSVKASTDQSNLALTDIKDRLFQNALHEPDGTLLMYLDTTESGERIWNAVKVVRDQENHRLGLVFLQFSLEKYDGYVEETLRQVYIVAILSLCIILLLILNHTRLFRYAIKATRLEEVDRMKDDFISMASHELKSPMTVLKGYLEMLGEGLAHKGVGEQFTEEKQYIRNMNASVERLVELVEDILNVSRIEQNRLPLEMTTFDLRPVLEEISQGYRILAEQKGLVFECEVPERLLVIGDGTRVKQIIVNLLSNAVKYTQKGTVAVLIKEEGNRVKITVADTGLGIGPEGLSHLFEKFYRVRTEATATISGTGLGLWISREIARKMGGDLIVESIEGVGSHFTLLLTKNQ